MAEMKGRSFWNRFLKKFRNILIAGLVVTVPIGLTIWIFVWIFDQIDKILQPIIRHYFGKALEGHVTGIGFIVIFILVLIIGAIATNNLGKRIVHWGESFLGKIPITRTVYDGIRQIIQSFSDPDKTGFMQVVMIQYPEKVFIQ